MISKYNAKKSEKVRDQRSILLFESGIKTEATLKGYTYSLDQFLKFCKVIDYDSLVKIDPKKIQIMIEDYLMICKKKYSYGTIDNFFSAIQLFFTMNDVPLNFKKIRKMFPEREKPLGDKAYTTKDIKLLLDTTKTLKFKALIHLLASSGVRAGSIHDMQIKDLKDVGNGCKSLRVYHDSKDEYFTFISPEAVQALDIYFEQRISKGEKLSEESYLFLTDTNKKFSPEYVSITMCRLAKKVHDRKISNSSRYDVMASHGFRKRFNSILKMRHDCNLSLSERLMGHSTSIQLDNSYFKPTLDQLLSEYLKALPDLMIDESLKLKGELEKKQNEIELLKQNQDERILLLEAKQKEIAEHLKNLRS